MSNTRKPITSIDELCDQLFSPPPLDESGPQYPLNWKPRREPLIDWVRVACWFGLLCMTLIWVHGARVLLRDLVDVVKGIL